MLRAERHSLTDPTAEEREPTPFAAASFVKFYFITLQ